MKSLALSVLALGFFLISPVLAQSPNEPTVNGFRLNVTQLTLGPPISGFSLINPQGSIGSIRFQNNGIIQDFNGLQNQAPLGTMAFPQSVPAAPATQIPGSLSTLPTSTPSWTLIAPPSLPSLAVARPDFLYQAAKLSFERLTGTSSTGQKGMDAGPGTPAGVKRFVPVGEY